MGLVFHQRNPFNLLSLSYRLDFFLMQMGLNPVGDDGVEALLKAVKKNKSLKVFSLEVCAFYNPLLNIPESMVCRFADFPNSHQCLHFSIESLLRYQIGE